MLFNTVIGELLGDYRHRLFIKDNVSKLLPIHLIFVSVFNSGTSFSVCLWNRYLSDRTVRLQIWDTAGQVSVNSEIHRGLEKVLLGGLESGFELRFHTEKTLKSCHS
jgi:hypothetical protein